MSGPYANSTDFVCEVPVQMYSTPHALKKLFAQSSLVPHALFAAIVVEEHPVEQIVHCLSPAFFENKQ